MLYTHEVYDYYYLLFKTASSPPEIEQGKSMVFTLLAHPQPLPLYVLKMSHPESNVTSHENKETSKILTKGNCWGGGREGYIAGSYSVGQGVCGGRLGRGGGREVTEGEHRLL